MLYDIPEQLKRIHQERGEIGVTFHPGYKVTPCKVCGQGAIHSRQKDRDNCGSPKCSKDDGLIPA